MMKYKWKVEQPPTGRYRSFSMRGWPEAEYEDGRLAANICCADEYYPPDVKIGKHAPLIVTFCDYSAPNGNCEWTRKRLKAEFATLAEAKAAFAEFLKKYPEKMPTAVSK